MIFESHHLFSRFRKTFEGKIFFVYFCTINSGKDNPEHRNIVFGIFLFNQQLI